MFTESFFANATPEQASLLADIHLKRNDAIECVSELKKKLRGVKTKVNKFEKVIPFLDDKKYSTLKMVMVHNSQLAMNKYVTIEKYINYRVSMIKGGERQFRELKKSKPQNEPYFNLTEKLKYILSFYSFHTHSEALNQIRIAHVHLKKIDDHLALLRKYNMIPKNWLNSFLQN